jgi:hypothetical protein
MTTTLLAMIVGGFIGIFACLSVLLISHLKETGSYNKVKTELDFTLETLKIVREENISLTEQNDRLSKELDQLNQKIIVERACSNRLHEYNEYLVDKMNFNRKEV